MKTYCHTFRSVTTAELFNDIVTGRRVLDVGFADWPHTRGHKSFHRDIHTLCKTLDGYDINKTDNIDDIAVPNGRFYWDWDEVPRDGYDVIIARETIEHVGNVETFLRGFDAFDATLVITAPDALMLYRRDYFDERAGMYTERNHEDHNYWFTLYTLRNVIRKYSNKTVIDHGYVDNHSCFVVAVTPGTEVPAADAPRQFVKRMEARGVLGPIPKKDPQ